jgi:hypothetical protein
MTDRFADPGFIAAARIAAAGDVLHQLAVDVVSRGAPHEFDWLVVRLAQARQQLYALPAEPDGRRALLNDPILYAVYSRGRHDERWRNDDVG